jgi:fatty-acyl-CoA synthase
MTTILGRVLEFASREPDRLFANVWDARRDVERVTYGAYIRQAAGIAERLRREGLLPGEVAVVILKSGSLLMAAWLAPQLVGAIPTIFPWPTEKLDRAYYAKTVASLLKICGAAVLMTSRDLLDTLAPLTADAPQLRRIITLDEVRPAESLPEVPRELREDARAIAILQHSSGSTGLQKGVALSSQAVMNQIENYGKVMPARPDDRIANWLPLYHDGGLVPGFLQPLLRGVPLSILSPIDWVHDPVLLLEAITRDRVTHCWQPNFAFNFLATKIPDRKLEGIDLSSVRVLVNMAEPVRLSSHELFLRRFLPYGIRPLALQTLYGMAENTAAATQSDPSRPVTVDVVDRAALSRERRAVAPRPGGSPLSMLSSGAPIPGTEIVILDEKFERLPDRRVGEIALRSDCMLTEYFRRPDLTEKAFHDGWYLSGDYGYLAGGELFVTGRKKDLIIVGGKNIYPQDLEFVADGVPGVHPGRTVAFGIENEQTGTEDVVVLFEKEGPEDPRGVIDAVREAIAHQSDCVARTVVAVPQMWLVKTSSGKISRTRCREKFLKEWK